MLRSIITLCALAGIGDTSFAARVVPVADPPAASRLESHGPGRVLRTAAGTRYQWPGIYFEARFDGTSVFFGVGPGEANLRVLVDGQPVATLVKPAAGVYEIGDLARGTHVARIEALMESQAGPVLFTGFSYPQGTRPLPPPRRARQIEFIGDSHTVGYGNTSNTRDCTPEAVWSTTDNTAAFGPQIARHYDADYQVNAISGRGIVRNYDGSSGDPLPVAYPFVLLDHDARYEDAAWHPQVVVIALGTNDFSTPLHAGEKWATRAALHADYESTYVAFLERLRARDPRAWFLIWATDMADGEIQREARKVVQSRQAAGDRRIEFVAIDGLAMSGCHWHPSVADHQAIAAKLIPLIDAHRPWGGR